jgi:hypothetical protein
MAEFMAVLECIAARKSVKQEMDDNGKPVREPTPPAQEINEAELEDTLNDLLEIKKKDILKKNIGNILRENFELKNRVKYLEEQLKTATERSGLDASLSFRIGKYGIYFTLRTMGG